MTEQLARRVEVAVTYNGKDISASLAESLLDFSYSDNPSGSVDDVQLNVEDVLNRWQGPWNPDTGDVIQASIRTVNWEKAGETKTLPCGTFEVDTVDINGPPDVVSIKALSLPAGTSARSEKRSKAWEKFKLQAIAQEIAIRAKLKLVYEVKDNPQYERLDQTEQTDLAFLLDLCNKECIAVKVSGGKLVLFDERQYEASKPVATIKRGVDNVLGYTFGWSATDAVYRASILTYKPPKAKKEIKVDYTPPGAPKTGPVLRLNENVASQAEALRVAKNRLREQNKNFGKASLSLAGDTRLSAGSTVVIDGWGRYDGKYIIERATHTVGSGGYTTQIEIRRVLGW